MKKIAMFFCLVACSSVWCSVITTNILGEYFDLENNSTQRYIYGQLNLTTTGATLQIFPPLLTNGVAVEVASLGLANIFVKPVVVTKTLAELVIDKKIGADVEITFNPNLVATPGYLATMSILGQVLNTNIYSNPNPVQYFMLQMTPLTAGLTQNVFCDLLYNGTATDKWLLPPENNFPSLGVFLAQSWKTPIILQSKTNVSSKIAFSFQIPLSSFANLDVGTYQIRIAVVMLPLQAVPSFNATQVGSLTRLLESAIATATAPNSIYVPNAAQLVNIKANAAYLTKLIADVTKAAAP